MPPATRHLTLALIGAIALLLYATKFSAPIAAQDTETLDPTAWGDDHVGKRMPDYTTGGECLFCHRFDVGEKWQQNRHNHAMSLIEDSALPALQALLADNDLAPFADETAYLVGDTRMKRYLKPNGRYGQAAMLSTAWLPPHGDAPPSFREKENPKWNDDTFAESCAGCHATAVETEYNAYSTYAIDCFACHGIIPAAHNTKPELALYAATSKAGPQVEMSICAQCHLRGGKSKTSGRPYPNQFIPGDNLFKDFQVDLSPEHIATLNPSDQHVYQNVRDVVLLGNTKMTCTTCHDVHESSTRKHRVLKRLQRETYCAICHDNLDNYESLKTYPVHNPTCQY